MKEKQTMMYRKLGRSGIEVSAIGLGCWAIGGPWTWSDGRAMGWGQVDDAESIRAIHRALDLGINFFDTAANYGAGHSEQILGQAVAGRREQVIIATKFGHLVDEQAKVVDDNDALILQNVRRDCENSLRRLKTDYIDLYQLHEGRYNPVQAVELRGVLEELVAAGKIRCYGWSTDLVDRARIFAEGDHCASVQHRLNIFYPTPEMLALCDTFDIASINKLPLNSGILTGKYSPQSKIEDDQSWRHQLDFSSEQMVDLFAKLDAIREILTSNGHSLAQAALAWILAYHQRAIPIPGFRNSRQVEDSAGVLTRGPLSAEQMQQIEALLGRSTV